MVPSSGTSRSSRRAKARRRRHLWQFFSVAVLCASAAGLIVAAVNRRAETAEMYAAPIEESAALPSQTDLPSLTASAASHEPVVYPYSIVPGGVASVEALKAAIARDPVVAEHYRDFDIKHARVERLDVPRVAHVSYRIGNDVFWTRKVLVVPAGERVITDGAHLARTRCGNQLAAVAPVTSAAEPAARVLDTPVTPTPMALASASSPASTARAGAAPGSSGNGVGVSHPSGSTGGGAPSVGGPGVAAPGILIPSGEPAGTNGTNGPNGDNSPQGPPQNLPGQQPPAGGNPPAAGGGPSQDNSSTPPGTPGNPPSSGPIGGNPFPPPPGGPGNPPPLVPTDGNPFLPPPGGPNPPTTLTPPGDPGGPQQPPNGDTPGQGGPNTPGGSHDPGSPNGGDDPTPVPVPEPGYFTLMAMGLGTATARLRRRG